MINAWTIALSQLSIDMSYIELIGCQTAIMWRAVMDCTAASASDRRQSRDLDGHLGPGTVVARGPH